MGRQRKMKMEKDNRYIQKERENNMYTIDREIMKQVHKGKEINRICKRPFHEWIPENNFILFFSS